MSRPATDTLKHQVQAALVALADTHALIDSHCDGPLTLYSALQTIATRLQAVGAEAALVETLVTDLLALADQLKTQRDAALAARDQAYRRGYQAATTDPQVWMAIVDLLHGWGEHKAAIRLACDIGVWLDD
jgi:hypothetical protein